jgi:hypothetical protein
MSSVYCPDCHEGNFGSATFCKKCGADFNERPPFSRVLGRKSIHKTRRKTRFFLNLLDMLEDTGGPQGWSLRINRPPDKPTPD